jgi:transcription-repair coupling factor (superfamily II helicase)
MTFSSLLSLADGWETLAQAEDALRRGRRSVQIEGLPVAAKGWLLARLAQDWRSTNGDGTPAPLLLVLTYNEEQALRLANDLRLFLPAERARTVQVLPSSLSLLLDDEESGRDVGRAGRRLDVLTALANGEMPAAIVASAAAILQRTPPPAAVRGRRIRLAVGDTVNLDVLSARLTAFGYTRETQISLPGTFARRGDILDVFPSNGEKPVRFDLFGDEIETIRPFDPDTQRSDGKIDAITVVAAHEIAYTRDSMARATEQARRSLQRRVAQMQKQTGIDPSVLRDRLDRLQESGEADVARLSQAVYFPGIERFLPLLHPDAVTALDFLPTEGQEIVVVLDEPAQMRSHAEREIELVERNLEGRVERGEILPIGAPLCEGFEESIQRATGNRPTLMFALLARSLGFLPPAVDLNAHGAAPAESFVGKPGALADAMDTYVRNSARVIVVSAQAPRIRGLLQDRNLSESPLQSLLTPKSRGIALVNGVLPSGFRLPDAHLVVLTDAEIFGAPADRAKEVRRRREFREGLRITSLLDLKDGDYVVHIHHGIGIFRGLTKMTVQNVEKEYLLVLYEGGDKLYVPVDQVDRVQKYIGSEGGAPPINRLGGTEWAKTTARAKRQVREIAGELIALYAARQSTPGHAYGEDTPWQKEMEDVFPYTETPDQAAAIEDVKRDLEQPRPMDRLICGDVGYGKTEVAVRAAFKVASEGRQVAILCPTTVLAAQHYATFSERFAGFPLKVDMLSRFRSPREQARTIDEIKLGVADLVIGTHRLLSKDVEFKDLGLVIVDEEQRFGVGHKERLKQLRKSVDVLTMTATPIPRTLHMSLSGIRDMSLINDPPEGRTPVRTLIKEYDDDLIREAILRETDRGGQIYFIHNRVESIYHVAGHLQKIVPTARLRVAHGQMGEDDLEETMLDFYEHKFDVLVCTTIVESGLDISNVNTIVIDAADKLGLAQLYQLRGRVGRSPRQAYALLLYRKNKVLSTIAEQRLGALREFSDLGSGYKVALRDLELRGAGNLLGAEQSGTVAAVGFDLYTQLLEQAVKEYKGEEPDKVQIPLPTVDLPVAAAIPSAYVPGEAPRILMYKKLAAVRDRADVARLQEEFEDRFGDPPAPVWNALALLRLRLRCQEIGIESITTESNKIQIVFGKGTRLPTHTLRPLTIAFKAQGHSFTPERVVMNIVSSKTLTQVEEMVEILARAIHEKAPPRVSPGGSGPTGTGARRKIAPTTPGRR